LYRPVALVSVSEFSTAFSGGKTSKFFPPMLRSLVPFRGGRDFVIFGADEF
jgi:hypothetical protein